VEDFTSLCVNSDTVMMGMFSTEGPQPLYRQFLLIFVKTVNSCDWTDWFAKNSGNMPGLHWHWGWLYAIRLKWYNPLFRMVFLLYDVTVSACATRDSFFLIDRVRNQCLVGFPANVGLEPSVNDGAKRPLSRCQQQREAPIITVSRASPLRLVSTTARSAHYHGVLGFALAARTSPSRLGLRPRGALRTRGSLYELVIQFV